MHCEGEIMMTLNEIGSRAKEVSRVLGTLGSREKNMGLEEAARALLEGEEEILEANSRDYEKARSGGMSQGLLDRLKLTPARVQAMADGLLQVAGGPCGRGAVHEASPQRPSDWAEACASGGYRHDL